ncbi:hypothetical protein BDZ89DRAFT_1132294 [Hymenopellis radicata]|nr:hypothetical protein BDZ89DRAFT_1132294 [Hymenopellis radicata]
MGRSQSPPRIAVRETLQEKKDELEDVRSAYEALKEVAKQTEIANFELRSALNKLTARLNDASAEVCRSVFAWEALSHSESWDSGRRRMLFTIDVTGPLEYRLEFPRLDWLAVVWTTSRERSPGPSPASTIDGNEWWTDYADLILQLQTGPIRTNNVNLIVDSLTLPQMVFVDLQGDKLGGPQLGRYYIQRPGTPLPIFSDLTNVAMDALYAAARLLEDASSDASLAYPSSSPHIRQPLAPSQFPFTYQCPPPSTGRTSDEKVVAVAEPQASEIENAELEPERPTKRQCRRRLTSNQEAFENWLLEYPEETTCDSRFRVLRRERRWIRVFKFKEHKVICRKCDKEVQLNKKTRRMSRPG